MKTSLIVLIEKVVVGKKIAKQDSIHESYWGSTVTGVSPCEYNYGCDSGFLILTNGIVGCNAFMVDSAQEIQFED